MAFSHSYAITVTPNGGTQIGATFTVTAGQEVNISESIAGATTNGLLACVLDVSQVKSMVLYCTRDMTVKTNSSGSPAATVSLQAGKPLVWESTQGQTNPFGSTDVTSLYITLAAGDAATFEMRCLVDPTV